MALPARWKSAKAAQLLLLASSLLVPTTVWAQDAAMPAAAAAAAPSESAMVNLVRLLVAQKVLKKEQGDALMAQALAEAAQARAAVPVQQAQADLPSAAPGSIRVPYIPETVRAQIRDELKTEVLAQAKSEGWAAPGDASPDWVRRIKLSGDIRFRSQSNLFSKNNSNQIPDFARLNQIGPIAYLDGGFVPVLNSTIDRANRLEVRARLGIAANIMPGIEAGMMLASGNDNSPISTNQNLGGGFAKRDIWLDQAYLRLRPTNWAKVELGRFVNPFFSTDLLFDDDLRFDGAAFSVDGSQFVGHGLSVALRGGAFPLDFGDPNFPQNDFNKRHAPERWLFSGQLELGALLGDSVSIKLAAGYHDFTGLQAHLSSLCNLYFPLPPNRAGAQCSTDNERATFLRKGNTVFGIRDINLFPLPSASDPDRVRAEYVGLVFNYRVLNLNAQAHYKIDDDFGVTLTGDYVRNLAFHRSDLCRYGNAAINSPQNNGGSDGNGNICDATDPTSFVGGNQGYLGRLTVGHDKLFEKGHWQATLGYRYLESDAVLDAFTDSDFHLGGTNAKGYIVGAKASLFNGMTVGARWLSANEISGEPFRIDVLQADLEVAF